MILPRLLSLSLLSACALAPLSGTAAEGMLGYDLVSVEGGYVWSNDDAPSFTAGTITLTGRTNILRPENHGSGVDLVVAVDYLSGNYDDFDVDFDGWSGGASVVYFYDRKSGVTPFVTADLGYASSEAMDVSEDSPSYGFGLGAELYLQRGFTLVPQVKYTRLPDFDSDYTVDLSVTAMVTLGSNTNFLASFTHTFADEYDASRITAGFLMSY